MSVFREKLANGLTLLVQPLPRFASLSISLVVKTGSRYESPGEAGWCHLAEHMFFQGTRRRDNRELSRVINAVGGNLDAYTSRESTAFHAKVPPGHLNLALDVIADMLAHSLFSPSLLRKEKGVILEEIRMYEDEPEELIHDHFAQGLWPRHALGHSILGTRETLAAVNRSSLLDFIRRQYRPEHMLLAVSGRVTPGQVRKFARRYFAGFVPGDGKRPPLTPPPAALSRPLLKSRRLEQIHVCVGVRGLPYSDPRRIALVALSNILGGGTNSRLFYEIRERRALAYAVYSFMDFFYDTGLLGIYLACHPGKLSESLKIIRAELQRLATQAISQRELRDLREQMRGNFLLSLENSSTYMWRMVQNEMYLQQHPGIASVLRHIRRLEREDLRTLAHELFAHQSLYLAALGPIPRSGIPTGLLGA